jgi:hypothetical protein
MAATSAFTFGGIPMLTGRPSEGRLRIMGDKSPKAKQKQKAQQQGKAASVAQKKNASAAAKSVQKPKR